MSLEAMLLEHVHDLAVVLDGAGSVVFANRAARDALGGDLATARSRPAETERAGRWFAWTWTDARDGHLLGIGRDRSDERRARATEERFELAARAARDLIYDWDIVHDRLVWGGNAPEVFGLGVAEMGVTVADWAARIHPDDLPEVDRALEAAIATGTTFEGDYRFRRGDDSYAFVHDRGLVVAGPDGRAVRMVGSMQDVTARRQAEERYRFIAETTSDVVYDYDVTTDTFPYLSPRVEEWLGIPAARFEKEPGLWWALIAPQDRQRVREFFERECAERRPRTRVEYRIRTASGELQPVHDAGALVYDATGQCVRVKGTVSDVTQLHALKAELERAQKLESVGRLAGGIAHDFNNLLTGILANVTLARARVADEAARESLAEVERAADRAGELVRGLLAYSRRAPFEPAPVDVHACVHAVVRLLRPTLGPKIEIDVHAVPVAPAWADAGQVEQALVNLALNARDAMPDGGRLRFAVDEVTVERGTFIRIAVEDTGVGMGPEVRARAFEPFFTTKEQGKGSGLGLAVVHGIVRQHEGWIDLETAPGAGARFLLHLPRSSEPLRSPAAAPGDVAGGRESLLVVDDERSIRNTARAVLESYGYRVALASDGLEALEAFRRTPFDLVVLDLTMPGMSGREAYERLRAISPRVPVIVSSGYALEGDAGLEGARFLSKPYRPEELARAVREALDAGR